MSETFHHSLKWGKDHKFADRPDRGYGMSRRGVGEAPGWHVRLYDTKPARREDRCLLRKVLLEMEDPDEVIWCYTGTKRPHSYYW